MFDYSLATVRPWPTPLPFVTSDVTLVDVCWKSERCDALVEVMASGERWLFSACAPLVVSVQEDEGQVLSLWRRRDECCPGAAGFLVVEKSPLTKALLTNEPQTKIMSNANSVRHFVLGTAGAVAHILCDEAPTLAKAEAGVAR